MGSPEPIRYLRKEVEKLAKEVEKLAGDGEKDIADVERMQAKVESLSKDVNRLSGIEPKSDALYKMVNLVKEMVDLNHDVLVRVDKRVTQHAIVLNKITEFCNTSLAESELIAEYLELLADTSRLDAIEHRIKTIEESTTQ